MKPEHLFLIGLTGGIACGKSAVVKMLASRGATTIDADRVTHQLQRPGTVVHQQIVSTFGMDVLRLGNCTIDRAKLGARVFSDKASLKRLEQIVHPAVRVEIATRLANAAAAAPPHVRPVAVVDAIKLLESGWKAYCDQVWVVTCAPEQQIERLMQNRGMSEAAARQRVDAQPPQESRLAQADVVIDNSGTLEQTREQVYAAWEAIQEELYLLEKEVAFG
jgi:dephospho-CoA kinase